MTPSGAVRRIALAARSVPALLLGALLWSGCYGFSGGGGLPKQLKTVAIEPFDNQTAVPELQREVFEQLRAALRDRLNLREAPAARADVVVRGTLVKYDVDLPSGVSADSRQTTSTRRRLLIVIDVEIIDQTTGRTLLKKSGLQREGQYAEGGEVVGRKNALESLISDLVEGVQSQW
ncbi:LPS assembly lipoprotein LptE [Gemmatimonas sp.]|uniref:LPS assembly lipoprotein LptE n=1 Tax=Gemmatimonas sp. TaxID=1962908 RepID=UPI00356A8B21